MDVGVVFESLKVAWHVGSERLGMICASSPIPSMSPEFKLTLVSAMQTPIPAKRLFDLGASRTTDASRELEAVTPLLLKRLWIVFLTLKLYIVLCADFKLTSRFAPPFDQAQALKTVCTNDNQMENELSLYSMCRLQSVAAWSIANNIYTRLRAGVYKI